MQIGDFRFITSNRGLAACLAVLGVPFKEKVPITNEYGEQNQVPQVPFGHPRWRAGRLKWHLEAVSQSWTVNGKPIMPKAIVTEYHSGKAAGSIEERFKAMDESLGAGNIPEASSAWLALKNDMPYILAGFIGAAEKTRERIFMPMLKAAYEQEKTTGLSINMITIAEGAGEIHTSVNPSEAVKDSML